MLKLKRSVQIPSISRLAVGQLLVIGLIFFIFLWHYPTCPTCSTATAASKDCKLSLLESDGFFCEPDYLWKERKHSHRLQDKANMNYKNTSFFFLDNWTPDFHCSNARRIGSTGEGGKWVCDPHQLKSRSNCLVYSAGSNGEYSFEFGMKEAMPHCEIHTFDKDLHPYPNGTCIFHTVYLGDGRTFSKTWTTIVNELNHTNRIIDIFKIDIEGDEHGFMPVVFAGSSSSFPRQILIELHPHNTYDMNAVFKLLRSKNYVIFSKEQNLLAGQYYFEYSFLRMNQRFFTKP